MNMASRVSRAWAVKGFVDGKWVFVGLDYFGWKMPSCINTLSIATWKTRKLARQAVLEWNMHSCFDEVVIVHLEVTIDERP